MSEPDLVMRLWDEIVAAELRTCPSQADIALAALNRPEQLLTTAQHHLLDQRCDACERTLLRVWSLADPSPAVLDDPGAYPPEGAFGAALREHVASCDAAWCREVAAEFAADARDKRPAGLAEASWTALKQRFQDWVGGLVDVRAPVPLPRLSRRPVAIPDRSFGLGAAVKRIAGRDDAVTLVVDAVHLGELATGGDLLAVLQREDGEVLAAHVFERLAGGQEATVEVSAADATRSDVRLVLINRGKRR